MPSPPPPPPAVVELPEPVHDPDEVRRLAEEILAQPRYDEPAEPLLDRILNWIGERIGDLLESLGGGAGGGGSALGWVVLVLAVAAIGYLVFRYARGINVERRVGPEAPPAMIELTRSPAEWRAEAHQLAGEGRFREALRCRHRALVADLVAQGVIPEIPGRTAREYVADVAVNRPAAGPAIAEITEVFEAAWYGNAATGHGDLARVEELEVRVLRPEPVGGATR
jgi:hypothetical protein